MKENKQKNIIYKFLVGFLIPYLLINGIILFLVISSPKIEIVNDIIDQNNKNLTFNIKSILPLTSVTITRDDLPLEFDKNGSKYTLPINKNGTIKIEASSINKMTVVQYHTIDSLDDVGPTINTDNAIFAANILTLSITDNNSGVNYSKVYGTIDNEIVQPIFIDKSTGTVKFKINNGSSIIIHVEDNAGNFNEIPFESIN